MSVLSNKQVIAEDATKQVVDQLTPLLTVALVGMLDQIDVQVSIGIAKAVSEQRTAFVDALRHIRRLAEVGPARSGAVWGELDALLVRLEGS